MLSACLVVPHVSSALAAVSFGGLLHVVHEMRQRVPAKVK